MRDGASLQSPDPLTIVAETFPSADRTDSVFGPFDPVPGKAGVIAGLEDIDAGETSIIPLHNWREEIFISL